MYSKFYIYKEQVTYNSGETWSDTGVQTPSGDPIGSYSTYDECMGIVTCDCSAFTASNSISVPTSGGTFILGTFSDDCLSGFSYSFTTPTGMITNASVSGGTNVSAYTATISANQTTSARTGTVTVAYNAGETSCSSSTISVSQSAATPSCNCDNFVFNGTIESGVTPTQCLITFSVQNDTSYSQSVGTFEIFHQTTSVQVPIDVTLVAQGSTAVTVDIGAAGLEGNTITKVEGVVNNVSHCYQYYCSPSTLCDLGDGDTLLVKLSETTTCS